MKMIALKKGAYTLVNPTDEEDGGDDIDVAKERQRVAAQMGPNGELKPGHDAIVIEDMTKIYNLNLLGTKKKRAVNHLTVGIARGECFGLLGVNGAGKTTSFKSRSLVGLLFAETIFYDDIILFFSASSYSQRFFSTAVLTGDLNMTEGHAYLAGYDVHSEIAEAQQRVGYCPQFDGLIELMTGRELLSLFARLRGIPEASIPSVVVGCGRV